MGTNIDTLWLFALATKSSTPNPLFSISFVFLFLFLGLSLLYWAHPGGPAWGKHYRMLGLLGPSRPIPGPSGIPLLGSFSLLTGLPHRKIAAAATRLHARRLMAFSAGDTRVVVSCHPDTAREILTSAAFSDRPVRESAYRLMFSRAIGFAPCGAYWRALRRISATHFFSPKMIKAHEAHRAHIGAQMVSLLKNSPGSNRVRDVLKRASLSNMMMSVFGREYGVAADGGDAAELRAAVEEGYEILGVVNWGDHLGWLAEWDLQRVRSRCARLVPNVNRFVGRIIEEHRAEPSGPSRDFVDVLLSLDGSDKLSDSDMIAVLWEMIFRGTDTVAVLIEWILARLVLHPHVQSTVHDELDKMVGRSRAVDESDLPSLPYLTAVIKEVLRLHPPGPLLSWARLAIEDTVVDGYHVPAGTTAKVNMWAITHDPEVWPDPLEFRPERFGPGSPECEFSVLGSDLRLAPFGSGRRSCPGKQFGLTTVSFWVATLLHEFEFVSSAAAVDLSEVLKLSCEMVHPLTVEVRSRRGIRSGSS